MSTPTVIYIGGHGRSGTTIVDRVLAEITGGFSAGEIHRFWEYGLARNWKCSCGERLRDCELWGPVLQQSFSEAGCSESEILAAWETVARPRSLLSLWSPRLRSERFQRQLTRYRSFLEVLYRRVAQRSDKRIVVDSSGSPLHGYILSGLSGVEVVMVHLVRDARAVAFSNQKQKPNPSAPGRDATMRTKSFPRVAVTWLFYNRLLENLEADVDEYKLAKYEELFAEPEIKFEELAGDLGVEPRKKEVLSGGEIDFSSTHIGQGNPSRLKRWGVNLKTDDEWRVRFSGSGKKIMYVMCYHKMNEYGYL